MAMLKAELNKAGVQPQPEENIRPDPFLAEKRVPVKRLVARMSLTHEEEATGSFTPGTVEGAFSLSSAEGGLPKWTWPKAPDTPVVLPLSQHLGRPGVPVVKAGHKVAKGDVIAEIPDGALGARLHASVEGRVTRVTEAVIEITPAGTAGG